MNPCSDPAMILVKPRREGGESTKSGRVATSASSCSTHQGSAIPSGSSMVMANGNRGPSPCSALNRRSPVTSFWSESTPMTGLASGGSGQRDPARSSSPTNSLQSSSVKKGTAGWKSLSRSRRTTPRVARVVGAVAGSRSGVFAISRYQSNTSDQAKLYSNPYASEKR